MPEWLKQLLILHGSLGFADTLKTLVGTEPNYVKVPDQQMSGGMLGGGYFVDPQGQHSIGITPHTIKTFGNVGSKSYSGYEIKDKDQKSGDRVLGHEFGHLAMFGAGGNNQLQEQLQRIIPDVYDEKGMDDFQIAVQFLRNPKADTATLSPRQNLITNVLLQQPIYAQHPINQRRILQQILMGQLNR